MNTNNLTTTLKPLWVLLLIVCILPAWANSGIADGSEAIGVWQGDNEREKFEIYKT